MIAFCLDKEWRSTLDWYERLTININMRLTRQHSRFVCRTFTKYCDCQCDSTIPLYQLTTNVTSLQLVSQNIHARMTIVYDKSYLAKGLKACIGWFFIAWASQGLASWMKNITFCFRLFQLELLNSFLNLFAQNLYNLYLYPNRSTPFLWFLGFTVFQ